MKVFCLILIVLISGCRLLQQPPPPPAPRMPPGQIKEKTQKVIEIIQNKPGWLFPADECPAQIMPEFEREIEYLNEGCENKPDSCLEKCRREDGNACYALALLLQEQHGVEEKTSEPLFWRACKLGIISGCTNRAAAISNSETADEAQLKCAADTFEKTCARDDAWGCAMYGTALASGDGRERNKEEALKFLANACRDSSDEDEACKYARRVEAGLKTEKVRRVHRKQQ
jgi:hypothetical protein